MKEFLFIFPILLAVSIVLGGCRARTFRAIARESGKTFLRMTVGIALVCIVLQGVLWLIPRVT